MGAQSNTAQQGKNKKRNKGQNNGKIKKFSNFGEGDWPHASGTPEEHNNASVWTTAMIAWQAELNPKTP